MKKYKEFVTEIFLLEAKIDDLKLKHSALSIDHDPHGKFKTSGEIIDHFHSHNPTGNIQHTNWAINQYKKGNLKQEDAPMLKDTLQHFNKYKPKLEKKNIDQYKTVGELHSAIQPHVGSNKADVESQHAANVIKSGSTLVHDSKDVKLYHVHNTEASCELGKGMPWCTSRRDSQNMFNHYNESSGGKFYIAHLSKESAPHRKIGIGIGTGEFQDENNDRISHNTLSHLVERNPSLGKIKELQGVRVATTQDVHKHAIDLVRNDPENLGHMKKHPSYKGDETQNKILGYQNQMKEARTGVSEHVHSPYPEVRQELAAHVHNVSKFVKDDVINKLSKDSDPKVRSEIIKSRNVPMETKLHMAEHDSSPFVRGSFKNDEDFFPNKERLHRLIHNEKHPAVLGAWSRNMNGIDDKEFLKNKNSPSEAVEHIHIGNSDAAKEYISHPNAHPYKLGEIASNYPEHTTNAFSHKNFNAESLNTYGLNLEEYNEKSIDRILKHKEFSPKKHDQILWSHGREFSDAQKLQVLKHPEYTGEHNMYLHVGKESSSEVQTEYIKHIPTSFALHEFSKKIDTNNEEIGKHIADHPHATNHVIKSMANKFPNNEHIVGKYFNHPESEGWQKEHVAKKSSNPNIQKDFILNHPTFGNSSDTTIRGKHDPINMVGFERYGANDEVKKLAKKKLLKDYGEETYHKLHDATKDHDYGDFKHHIGGDWEEEK